MRKYPQLALDRRCVADCFCRPRSLRRRSRVCQRPDPRPDFSGLPETACRRNPPSRQGVGNNQAGKFGKKYAQGMAVELPSTSHLVVVDKDGNVVSMTTSIENAFGSGLMANGYLLNNELTDFAFNLSEKTVKRWQTAWRVANGRVLRWHRPL